MVSNMVSTLLSLLVWGSLVGGYSVVATQSITLPMSNIPISITLSELSLDKGTPLRGPYPPGAIYIYKLLHRLGFWLGDLIDLTFQRQNITLTHIIGSDTVYQNEIITRGF